MQLRAAIDRKIATDTYGTLVELCEWIASEGQSVSRSAMGRYVLKKQRQMSFTIKEATADELLDMQDAITGRLRALQGLFKPPVLPL